MLLLTDTDSLCYEIEAKNVYKVYADKDKFDNSDYPEGHPYQFNDNKKVIGKLKDETAGVPIVQGIKGIKAVIKKNIKQLDYKTMFCWQQSR